MHRPHELGLARAPAHAAGNRQRLQRLAHEVGQELRGGGARPRAGPEQDLAPAVVDAPQFPDTDTTGGCERERRPGRLAAGIKGGADGRTTALDLPVGLAVGERADEYREPARRRVGKCASIREAGCGETCGQRGCQRLREFQQITRWQLLGAELEQEVRALHAALPAAPRSIGKPSAARLA